MILKHHVKKSPWRLAKITVSLQCFPLQIRDADRKFKPRIHSACMLTHTHSHTHSHIFTHIVIN